MGRKQNMRVPKPTPRDDLSDADLAALAARADTGAFETIMRRYNQLLFRTARSILKSDDETQDAVQEAYLNAWRSLGSFRSDAKLSTWLVRIVINEALGRVRKRAGNVVPLDMVAGSLALDPEVSMEANHDDQPDQSASRAEVRRLMESRIDALPDVFRTVFVLRAVEEQTVEEVAAVLDIPEATVRSRFFRARSMLRESLSRDMDFALQDAFSFAGARCDGIVAGVLARIRPDGAPPPVS
jgi:RNA polymerase sigma-70 factor (ECF subfamily)